MEQAVAAELPDEVQRALDLDELRHFVSAGQARWPDFRPSPRALALAIACKFSEAGAAPASVASLSELDGEELWIGAAVAEGSDAAAAAFDRTYMDRIRPAIAHMKLSDTQVDDVLQEVRTKLLVAPSHDEAPRLLAYCGPGRLAALVKVVGLRAATDQVRQAKRRPHHVASDDADAVDELLQSALSPELEAVKQQHRAAFKTAFQEAIAQLAVKDRGLLRLHLIEGLNIDAIAALHDVHRATAARWLARIRERLEAATRRCLRQELALSDESFERLYLALQSQLDLSLTRLLDGD